MLLMQPSRLKFSSTSCILPYYVKRLLPPGDNPTAVNKYYYYYKSPLDFLRILLHYQLVNYVHCFHCWIMSYLRKLAWKQLNIRSQSRSRFYRTWRTKSDFHWSIWRNYPGVCRGHWEKPWKALIRIRGDPVHDKLRETEGTFIIRYSSPTTINTGRVSPNFKTRVFI
jgi:hypothetical protein